MTRNLPPGVATGLPALEALGVPRALPTSFNFLFLEPVPSDISPAVASPSLPDPAPILERLAIAPPGRGVPARLPEAGVAVCLSFFLDDSLPLDSESAGEPGRFKDLPFLDPSLGLPEGVLVPFDPVPFDLSLPSPSFLLSSSFLSSSFLSSSFLSSSLSSSSSSDELSSDYK